MGIFPNERERYSQVLARASHRNYLLYLALGETEENSTAKHVFFELAEVAKAEFHFWGTKGVVRADTARLRTGTIFFYNALRKFLGSETLVYLLLCGENARLGLFTEYCEECIDTSEQKTIRILLERSASFVGIVDPMRLQFLKRTLIQTGEVLICMSAVLIGLSLILKSALGVAGVGAVVVVAQTLATASATYFHAEHMKTAQIHRSTLLIGGVTFACATILLLPFLLLNSLITAVTVLAVLTLCMSVLVALYSSVLLQKPFLTQFFQIVILIFSAWFVAFAVSLLVNAGFPQ